MTETIKIDPGETIVTKLRKHWIILVRDAIGTAIVGLLPIVIIPLIVNTIPSLYLDAVGYASIASFATALWILIVWMSLFVLWTNYYLDVWIVTNNRIFNIEQINLFNRRVATWGMERIQEITVKIENPVQDFLNYGTIEIQTAGPTAEHATMEGIPDPNRARTIILEHMPHVPTSPPKLEEKVAEGL